MDTLKQKLYRSNSEANDSTHFPAQTHNKIGPIFPFRFFENSKLTYEEVQEREDPDFSHDPEEPLRYLAIPSQAPEDFNVNRDRNLKSNFGVEGLKNTSFLEIDLSMARKKTSEESRFFSLKMAKQLKYIRYMNVFFKANDHNDADVTWLCDKVLKFCSNLRELRILPSGKFDFKDKITESGYKRLVGCISTNLKKLESLWLPLAENESRNNGYGRRRAQNPIQKYSPEILRVVTRYPTTCLINLKHYNLILAGHWKIFEPNQGKGKEEEEEEEDEEDEEDEEEEEFEEDEEFEEEEEDEEEEEEEEKEGENGGEGKKEALDFSRLFAFNKTRFLRNLKEFDLDVCQWKFSREISTRSKRKLHLRINAREKALPTIGSVVSGVFEGSKSLESFKLRFNQKMREPAAIFLGSMVKGISLRADTLQNLGFDLNNKEVLVSEAFSKFDFAFSGDFAVKNTIKKLEVRFNDSYDFYGEDKNGDDQSDYGYNYFYDRGEAEPFTTKIIPQLTNLTSLRMNFLPKGAFDYTIAFAFMETIGKKLTKLEDLGLFVKCNQLFSEDFVRDLVENASNKNAFLPNLKNIRMDFSNCEVVLEADRGDPINAEGAKELEDAFIAARPDAKCVITLEGGNEPMKFYAQDSDGEENMDEPLYETDSVDDDSNEDLSDCLEKDEETGNDDWKTFLERMKKGVTNCYEFETEFDI